MHITEDFLPNLMNVKIDQIVQQSLHEIAKKILI